MNRKREQAELIFRIGQVVGPLLKLYEQPQLYDNEERVRTVARFIAEWGLVTGAIEAFGRGEQGHNYSVQSGHASRHFCAIVDMFRLSEAATLAEIQARLDGTIENLLAIPIPVDSTIHASHTPFSTYCLVKDLCSTVKTKIVWLDRYFDQTIFHRFFADTPKNVQIVLVTYPAANAQSRADKTRIAEFMDVSRLFAQERGPVGYMLVENANFHDRWLRCDDKLFVLGGSIKDLARQATFTISRLDSRADNLKQFDDAASSGTEIFGPKQMAHP